MGEEFSQIDQVRPSSQYIYKLLGFPSFPEIKNWDFLLIPYVFLGFFSRV